MCPGHYFGGERGVKKELDIEASRNRRLTLVHTTKQQTMPSIAKRISVFIVFKAEEMIPECGRVVLNLRLQHRTTN
jgi:hypothetical protein